MKRKITYLIKVILKNHDTLYYCFYPNYIRINGEYHYSRFTDRISEAYVYDNPEEAKDVAKNIVAFNRQMEIGSTQIITRVVYTKTLYYENNNPI